MRSTPASLLLSASLLAAAAGVCVGAPPGAEGAPAPAHLWLRLFLDTAGACVAARGGGGWAECLWERGGWWAERALRLRALPILEGVSLVRTARGASRALGDRDPLSRMLETFSLQVDPPPVLTDPRSLANVVEEGRGKLKKYWKPLLLIVTAIKAYLFFTALAALALFIGKALLVSKVALVLALSALYKKYFGGKKDTVELIKVQHHTQSHHQSEGYHHQEEHSSSSEWEGGSSSNYGYGGEESSYGSSGGGGSGGGYDKRRADDQGSLLAAEETSAAPGGGGGGADHLAYRGYRRREGGGGLLSPGGGRWSPREEGPGVLWKEGGREERSSDCWSDGFRRRKCPRGKK